MLLFKVRFLLVIIVLLSYNICSSQTYPRKEIDIDDFVLKLFSFQDEDLNYEDLYESLFQLYRNPLNLNRAERSQLQSLYILSEYQINNFLKHRRTHGKLLSIYELQAIEGYDLTTIYNLMPFVSIRDSGIAEDTRPLFQRIIEEENQFIMFRYDRTLEEKVGYTISDTSGGYLGDPGRLYLRYRSSHTDDFSIGFTMEKDPGEQITFDPDNNQYGADFNSFHATFYNKGRFKAISFGDYQVQVGQSLLLSAGFQVGKGAETTSTVRRSTTGIRPYTSVLENSFFRGIAATFELSKNIDITGFYSSRKIDFSTDTIRIGTIPEDFVSNTEATTGLHRTNLELSKKARVNEEIYGGHLKYLSKNKDLNIGLTTLYTNYELPISRRFNSYNRFRFQGSNNYNFGLDFSYIWQNFNFFGEFATSKSGGKAFIGGFVSSLSKIVEVSLLLRSFDRDFHSFYGFAFAESSGNINEKGIYWGLKIKPNKRWNFAAYYDSFKFPWLRFTADAPSNGNEYLFRLTYEPNKKLSMFAQYRYENKDINLTDNSSNIDFLVPTIKRNYVMNINYKISSTISLKSRVQFSNFTQKQKTKGFAIAQDLNFDLGDFKISTRFAIFDTEDFNNRQYIYERNVLYGFALPAYNGVGIRSYILGRWKINRKIDLWARYAISSFSDREIIGSGLNTINGNNRTDLIVQLRVKF